MAMVAESATAGQTLSLRVEAYDLVVGEQNLGWFDFNVRIKNVSDANVNLPSPGASRLAPSRFWRLHVEGPVNPECESFIKTPSVLGAPPPEADHVELPPGAELRLALGLPDIGAPGRYTVRVEYSGAGAPAGSFAGQATSDTVQFAIELPAGVDEQLVDDWRRANPSLPWCAFGLPLRTPELLQGYPGSIYTAYALRPYVSYDGSDPAGMMKMMADGLYPGSTSVPDDTCTSPDGWVALGGDQLLRWRERQYETIVESHPHIAFLGHLKLRRALDLIAAKRFDDAAATAREVAAGEDDLLAERARGLLREMVARGMTSELSRGSCVSSSDRGAKLFEERLRGRRAVVRREAEAPHDGAGERLADGRIQLPGVELVPGARDHVRDELVEDNADAEDVGACILAAWLDEQLGRAVARLTDLLARSDRREPGNLRAVEVEQHDRRGPSVLGHEDVVGPEVAMDHSPGVEPGDRVGESDREAEVLGDASRVGDGVLCRN